MRTIAFPPQVANLIQDFIANGLRDPRVANQTFPFDHPNLWSTRPNDKVVRLTGGVPGTGGVVPNMISATPPFVGNVDFKLGVSGARGGAQARLAVSFNPPVAGRVAERLVGVRSFTLRPDGDAGERFEYQHGRGEGCERDVHADVDLQAFAEPGDTAVVGGDRRSAGGGGFEHVSHRASAPFWRCRAGTSATRRP